MSRLARARAADRKMRSSIRVGAVERLEHFILRLFEPGGLCR
jgi:hypothetical protein